MKVRVWVSFELSDMQMAAWQQRDKRSQDKRSQAKRSQVKRSQVKRSQVKRSQVKSIFKSLSTQQMSVSTASNLFLFPFDCQHNVSQKSTTNLLKPLSTCPPYL